MSDKELFEQIIYYQKLAHKAWVSKAVLYGVTPSDEESEIVWDLLVSYTEAIGNFEALYEDIYKAAYELAKIALKHENIEQIYKVYRDYLLDAMMEFTTRDSVYQLQALVRFSSLISTAFCEAHSDKLKKTIRHARTEYLSSEMKLAKRIQTHLLPKVIPSIPGYEFAGRLVPAAEVGGDYWSVKHYEQDSIVTMKLADVSGHGIAAATLVAAVKFISGGYYSASKTAAEVMKKTNRVLCKETPHEILVSMVYGWLKPSTCELITVNAGHAPAFLCSENTCTDIPVTGPVLGLAEDADYGEAAFKLSKGSVVFFGSDGITEAGIGEPFGLDRLKKLVTGNTHLSANEIADLVVKTIVEYAGVPHDDISLLVVKVTNDPPARD